MATIFQIGPTEARECVEITGEVRRIVQDSGIDLGAAEAGPVRTVRIAGRSAGQRDDNIAHQFDNFDSP
jgi:hypothetical protein